MTYTTLTHFENLTEEQNTQLTNYITTAMSSGTTDGVLTFVTRIGVSLPQLSQRSWNTESNANAYVTFLNTFTPPPAYAQVVAPLVP
jgi:hypothetical protein